jgi:hypothetical protein
MGAMLAGPHERAFSLKVFSGDVIHSVVGFGFIILTSIEYALLTIFVSAHHAGCVAAISEVSRSFSHLLPQVEYVAILCV